MDNVGRQKGCVAQVNLIIYKRKYLVNFVNLSMRRKLLFLSEVQENKIEASFILPLLMLPALQVAAEKGMHTFVVNIQVSYS
jgi:hypothetical protein